MAKHFRYIHPRDQIVEIMRRIYANGMTTISGGNLSVIDENGDMWISPSGIDKGTLTRDDIVCVRADGAIVGKHKPSSEYPFHRAVYESRKDAKAVVHAHPPALVALSVAGTLPAVNTSPDFALICNNVGFAPYEIPGSEKLGAAIAAQLETGADCVMLENHGACVLGADLLDAFLRLETLDFVARTTINARINGGAKDLSKAQIDRFIDFIVKSETEDFTVGKLTEPTSADLESMRSAVETVRRAYARQLFNGVSGEIALRVKDRRFVALGSETDRAEADIADCFVVDGCKRVGRATSPYLRLFRAIFDAQPEINAIMVATPPALMGFAVTEKDFDPRVIPESYIMLREMPTLPFDSYRKKLDAFAQKLSLRTPAVIIRNECVIVAGKNPTEALDRLEVAEFSAKAAISAAHFGGLKPINAKQVKDLVEAFNLPT